MPRDIERDERVLLKLGWESKVHDGHALWVYRVPSDPLTGSTSGDPFAYHTDKLIAQMIEWLVKRPTGHLEILGPDKSDHRYLVKIMEENYYVQPYDTLVEALCSAVAAALEADDG